MANSAELTDEQQDGVMRLAEALDGLTDALMICRDRGLDPASAFRAVGIPVPTFAGAALNQMLNRSEQVPVDEQPATA